MFKRFRKWLNIDHVVDMAVDLFLILFDVLTSPILIVVRLARWIIGKYLLDGLKNKIKRLIHWTKGKPALLQIVIWTMTLCVSLLILTLMWFFGQAITELAQEAWGHQGLNIE